MTYSEIDASTDHTVDASDTQLFRSHTKLTPPNKSPMLEENGVEVRDLSSISVLNTKLHLHKY